MPAHQDVPARGCKAGLQVTPSTPAAQLIAHDRIPAAVRDEVVPHRGLDAEAGGRHQGGVRDRHRPAARVPTRIAKGAHLRRDMRSLKLRMCMAGCRGSCTECVVG